MKRILNAILIVALMLTLCACGQKETAPDWQEQYDLGVRYLGEGNYREAVVAFTAVIEIDEKRAAAYVGRGQAYVLSGETEENLTAAQSDYEKALELDETLAEAWLGLADVSIRRGEYEKALEILTTGKSKAEGNQKIADKIREIEGGLITDMSGKTRKSSYFESGVLIQYWLYEYDEKGNNIKTVCYDADGTWRHTKESIFDERGLETTCSHTYSDGTQITETFEYDEKGRVVKTTMWDKDGALINYSLITYDEENRLSVNEDYGEDGEIVAKFVVEYDEEWIRKRGNCYELNEDGEFYLDYYVEYIWNEDGTYGGFEHFQVAEEG